MTFTRVTAFAPATVANVAVGFDLMGFALGGKELRLGDEVTLVRDARPGVVIEEITALSSVVSPVALRAIPRDPSENTATVGILRLIEEHRLPFGFRCTLRKGIPLGSGMGGSAASAVAGVCAAAHFLPRRLESPELLRFALAGEERASGAAHADNAAPCLYGGLTLTRAVSEVTRLPVPPGLRCVLVHPHLVVETRAARALLKADVPLGTHVLQTGNLAAFLVALFQNDIALIGKSLVDLVVEPQRAHLVPPFPRVKAAALLAGALGASLSGSGPSLFAWAEQSRGERVRAAMVAAFRAEGVEADSWISEIGAPGARVIEEGAA